MTPREATIIPLQASGDRLNGSEDGTADGEGEGEGVSMAPTLS